MRWSKLRKIILEHPYIISDDFHMSISEAKRIQTAEGFPSFEEMVADARKRSPHPDSAWQEVYDAIERYKAQTNAKPKERRVFSNPFMRRWAIVGLCILLLVSYFTLVPSGRAIAATIADVVIEYFEDTFRIMPTQAPSPIQEAEPFGESITELSSFDSLEAATGKEFLQVRNDEYTLTSLQYYESEQAGKSAYAFYTTSGGLTVSLYHNWDITSDYWGQISQDDSLWEEQLSDGTIVYCSSNPVDNMFTGYSVWNDMFITIYVDNGVDYAHVLSAIS